MRNHVLTIQADDFQQCADTLARALHSMQQPTTQTSPPPNSTLSALAVRLQTQQNSLLHRCKHGTHACCVQSPADRCRHAHNSLSSTALGHPTKQPARVTAGGWQVRGLTLLLHRVRPRCAYCCWHSSRAAPTDMHSPQLCNTPHEMHRSPLRAQCTKQ